MTSFSKQGIRRWSLALALVAALVSPSRADDVDDYVREEMDKRKIPGLAFAVVRDGDVIKQEVHGLASVELGVEVQPETVFLLASIIKTFVSTAILRLVESGELALDDSVTERASARTSRR